MDSLLGNKYGTQSALLSQDVYRERLVESRQKLRYIPKATRTFQLTHETTQKKLQEMDREPNQPAFKLKRFQNVKNKVDTINRGYSPLRSSFQDIHARSVSVDLSKARKMVV